MSKEMPSLTGLTARLRDQAKEKKIAATKVESGILETAREYLTHLERILNDDLNGKTLRLWIDSTAHALGKNLSEEVLDSLGKKKVADGIGELVETEKEIAESNRILKDVAEMTGISVEELLGDTENEVAQAIVRLQEEKTAQVHELQTALRAYALELVHTLQEGNKRKLGMTKDELTEWEKKFVTVESMPQDYDSYAERLEQEFVAAKRQLVEFPGRSESAVDSKERSIAISEKLWGDYARHIVEILAKELPGDENEEKRRHLLAGLLRKGNDNLLYTISHNNEFAVKIHEDVLSALPESAVLDMARLGLTASMFSGLRLHDSSKKDGLERNKDNRIAYIECIKAIVALEMPETQEDLSERRGRFISGPNAFDKSSEDGFNSAALLKRIAQEVDLANQVDAAIKFLYDGLDETQKQNVSHWQNDYRVLSPVWRTLQNNPATFTPAFQVPVTPDGVFYSKMDEPEESRVSMQEATKRAGAFVQGLSSTLNKGKLQHERRAVTPADVKARNESRIFAAEQQALSAVSESDKGKEALKKAFAEKEAVEAQLRAQIGFLEGRIEVVNRERETAMGQLSEALSVAQEDQKKAAAEKVRLLNVNETQKGELGKSKKELADATSAMTLLLGELREAVKKPGVFGGDLKAAVSAILEREQPKE